MSLSSRPNPRHSLPNKSAYSCAKCAIALPDRQSLKDHCASLWHNHNLSLACRGVAPLSQEIYEMYREQHSQLEKERSEQTALRYSCSACAKVFGSKGTYDSHVQSARHRAAVSSSKASAEAAHVFTPRPDDTDEEDEDQWEEFYSSDEEEEEVEERTRTCFLCEEEAGSVEDNLRHLEDEHGFRLPYAEDVVSLEALMVFLSRKVGVYNECLSCDRVFRHATAARRHMQHKGHVSVRSQAYQRFYASPHFEEEPHAELADALTVRLGGGALLCHRSLRPYLHQRLSPKALPAVEESGGEEEESEESEESCLQLSVPARKLARARQRQSRTEQRARLGLGVRANRLQTHFRQQVTKAG